MNWLRRKALRWVVRLATWGLGPEHPQGNATLEDFLARCRALEAPRVLELGTSRLPERSTRRDSWVPNAGEYLGTDVADGPDVDIVADVHQLSAVVGEEQFDVVISCSTFEHLKYPHLAAHEILKVLRVGGILFLHTHQSFPLHSYPADYYRFSREALSVLFGTQMGFRVLATDYEYPTRLFARFDPNVSTCAAFLNVRLFGEKVEPTPEQYVYEFEC